MTVPSCWIHFVLYFRFSKFYSSLRRPWYIPIIFASDTYWIISALLRVEALQIKVIAGNIKDISGSKEYHGSKGCKQPYFGIARVHYLVQYLMYAQYSPIHNIILFFLPLLFSFSFPEIIRSFEVSPVLTYMNTNFNILKNVLVNVTLPCCLLVYHFHVHGFYFTQIMSQSPQIYKISFSVIEFLKTSVQYEQCDNSTRPWYL